VGDGAAALEDLSPGIADLPYLPLRLEGTSIRFQRMYRLATLASESPLAPLPAEATQSDVQAWARDELVPWVALRSDILAACREELRGLRGGEPDQHIIAAALLGYLYEDTALQLQGVRLPVPGNPRADVRAAPPERIEVLLEHARRSFERCLLAGLGELEVASYRQYCAQAIERLGPSSAEHFDDEAAREADRSGGGVPSGPPSREDTVGDAEAADVLP